MNGVRSSDVDPLVVPFARVVNTLGESRVRQQIR
jgi:hypothetical protein